MLTTKLRSLGNRKRWNDRKRWIDRQRSLLRSSNLPQVRNFGIDCTASSSYGLYAAMRRH